MRTSSPSDYPLVFAALAAFSIPTSFLFLQVAGQQISPADLLLWLAFVAWAWTRLRFPSHPAPATPGASRFSFHVSRFTLPDAAVAVLAAAALLSLVVARDRTFALYALRVLIIQPTALYVVVRFSGWGVPKLWWVVNGFVLGGAALALVGLISFAIGYGETADGVRRLLLPFYDSPNHIALYLGRVAPLAACVAAFGADRPRRVGYGLAAGLMLIAMALTASRGAWLLGLPAAAMAIALIRQGRPSVRLAAGAVAIASVVLALVFGALRNEGAGTPLLRVLLWRGAGNVIAAHPLLGVGIGNFHVAYPRYMLPEAWRETLVYHPHDIVLEYWSMMGVIGLASLGLLQVAFWRTGLSVYRQAAGRDVQALALGLMAGMAYGLVHGLVDAFYVLPDLALATMLALALVAALARSHP